MFWIYFTDVGKDKWCGDMCVDAETLEEAENTALFECRSRIGSDKVMLLHRGRMFYDVRNGMVLVGRVFIRSI